MHAQWKLARGVNRGDLAVGLSPFQGGRLAPSPRRLFGQGQSPGPAMSVRRCSLPQGRRDNLPGRRRIISAMAVRDRTLLTEQMPGVAAPTPPHAHHWIIQEASGPRSSAVCKSCRVERDFKNSLEDDHPVWRLGHSGK